MSEHSRLIGINGNETVTFTRKQLLIGTLILVVTQTLFSCLFAYLIAHHLVSRQIYETPQDLVVRTLKVNDQVILEFSTILY